MPNIDLFLAVLSLAFGLWAGVVAWGVNRITNQLSKIGDELKDESEKLNLYIIQTETRLGVLEDREKMRSSRDRTNGYKD